MNDPDPGAAAIVDPRGKPIETKTGRIARLAQAQKAADDEAVAKLGAKLTARNTSPLMALGVGTTEKPDRGPERRAAAAAKRKRQMVAASRHHPKKHARSKAHRGKASGGKR